MRHDIHKLADYLVETSQAGVVIEQKILEWTREKKAAASTESPAPTGPEALSHEAIVCRP